MLKLGIGLFAASCLLTYGISRDVVPGVPLAADGLDKTMALGCGQFPTTQGKPACSFPSPGCNPGPFWVPGPLGLVFAGIKCGNNGGPLGCSGLNDQWCFGTINLAAADMCYTYNVNCCTPTRACATAAVANGNIPGGLFYSCGSVAAPGVPMGTKSQGGVMPCNAGPGGGGGPIATQVTEAP